MSITQGRQVAAAYQCFLFALLLPYPGIAAWFHCSYFVGSAICARKVQEKPVVLFHGAADAGRPRLTAKFSFSRLPYTRGKSVGSVQAKSSAGLARFPKGHVGDPAGCHVSGMCCGDQHMLAILALQKTVVPRNHARAIIGESDCAQRIPTCHISGEAGSSAACTRRRPA